jgi:LmbE family N-acetylglucosaminyl deacetylase
MPENIILKKVIDKFTELENWDKKQTILIVLAHPDDPEYFCGGTIAKLTNAGHKVFYCIVTCGDKGTKDRSISTKELCKNRQFEQQAAARVLGVKDVSFLGYPDGYLVPDIKLRHDITRVIRQIKPDILLTCDPKTLFIGSDRINHPDHRAAGQATIDAVFPAAQDHLYFPDLLENENLEPHRVKELWITGTLQPNLILDVTPHWETKINAIKEHKSQIEDVRAMMIKMRGRLADGASLDKPRYEEKFIRMILS